MSVTSGSNAGLIAADLVLMENYYLEQTSEVALSEAVSTAAKTPDSHYDDISSSEDEGDDYAGSGMHSRNGADEAIGKQTRTTKRMEVKANGVEVFISGADNPRGS